MGWNLGGSTQGVRHVALTKQGWAFKILQSEEPAVTAPGSPNYALPPVGPRLGLAGGARATGMGGAGDMGVNFMARRGDFRPAAVTTASTMAALPLTPTAPPPLELAAPESTPAVLEGVQGGRETKQTHANLVTGTPVDTAHNSREARTHQKTGRTNIASMHVLIHTHTQVHTSQR